MTPFQILNARYVDVEKLLRFDTGRQRHRDAVREAIMDNSRNVYLYGSRGSGKTFFQKTQAHFLEEWDKTVLPLYIPCDLRWSRVGSGESAFSLHVLTTLFLEWWHKAYNRPKSDLLRMSTLGEQSVLDDLRSEQKRLVQLYSLVQSMSFSSERGRSSLLGATAVAKAETGREESFALSRGALLPAEISAIASELAEIIAKHRRRVVVQLDEVELLGINRAENFYGMCLELFNPVGVQFIVTGSPAVAEDHETLLNDFETSLELEGLEDANELKSMIDRYSAEEPLQFGIESVEVLYEFFGGHPRMSLGVCAAIVEASTGGMERASPRLMTSACLDAQRRFRDAMRCITGA